MVLKKIFILLSLLLVGLAILPTAMATASWTTWGNFGYTSGQSGERVLFGSNLINGTLTARINVTDSITITYPPLVQDLNLDGENEIIIVGGSSLYLYSADGELVEGIGAGSTLGRPLIINYQNDLDQEIVVCAGSNLNIYEYNGDSISLVKQWVDGCLGMNIKQLAPFDVGQTWDGTLANEVVFWGESTGIAKITSIDYNTGIKHNYTTVLASTNADRCFDNAPQDDWVNGIVVADIDRDNEVEAVVIYDNNTVITVASYSLYNQSFDWTVGLFDTTTTPAQCSLAYANLGGHSSAFEVFTLSSSSNPAGYLLHVIDSTGTEKYERSQTYPHYPLSFWSVADVDYDSFNEACFVNATEMVCLDTAYNEEYNWDRPTAENSSYIAVGEYDQVTGSGNFQELMTYTGLFSSDGSTLTKEFDIGGDDEDAMIYPVSINQYSTIFKDITYFDTAGFSIFYTNIDLAVCGNGACESGENSLNCFQDCGVDTEQEVVRITSQEICPNDAYVWQNGTQVLVSAKVESTDGSRVQARLRLYTGTANEWDSGWTDPSDSGTIFNFKTFANYTSYGTFLLEAKSELSDVYRDTYQFDMSIFVGEGWDHNDGCSFSEDPLETTSDQALQSDNLQIGDYCDTNDQCTTNYCRSGRCAKKLGSQACARGSECLSGRCINQKCSAPSFWQNAESLKTEMSGDDDTSNNIIALALILLGAVFVGYAMGKSMGGKAGVLMALGIMITGIVFFTLVGWLNPIFLVGILILALIGVVMIFMMRGDSS